MSDPVKKNRVVQTAWAGAAGFGVFSTLFEWLFGGDFDLSWALRTVLVVSVPLLMVDRLVSLSSSKMRQVLGPRFRIYAFVIFASFYWVSVTLFMWPDTSEFVFRTMAVWCVASLAFAAALSVRLQPTEPDLANQYLDLEKMKTGNVIIRTGYLWFPPFAAVLILGMASDIQVTEDGPGISPEYIMLQMVILLAAIGGLPNKSGQLGSSVSVTRMAGAALGFAAIAMQFIMP